MKILKPRNIAKYKTVEPDSTKCNEFEIRGKAETKRKFKSVYFTFGQKI